MKTRIALALSLVLATGFAQADDAKPAAKKAEKKAGKKAKPAAESDQNAFQKTESSVGDFANKHKIWITRPQKSSKKDAK